MNQILNEHNAELTGCAVALVSYVLRQIDLKRIKQGKKPFFEWFDVIKHK